MKNKLCSCANNLTTVFCRKSNVAQIIFIGMIPMQNLNNRVTASQVVERLIVGLVIRSPYLPAHKSMCPTKQPVWACGERRGVSCLGTKVPYLYLYHNWIFAAFYLTTKSCVSDSPCWDHGIVYMNRYVKSFLFFCLWIGVTLTTHAECQRMGVSVLPCVRKDKRSEKQPV